MHSAQAYRVVARLTPLALCLSVAFASGTTEAANTVAKQVPRTLTVDTCEDDGSAGALRQVVAGAASGDTIDLGP